jgi:hypothetical protein
MQVRIYHDYLIKKLIGKLTVAQKQQVPVVLEFPVKSCEHYDCNDEVRVFTVEEWWEPAVPEPTDEGDDGS